jgi:hypothetical protein
MKRTGLAVLISLISFSLAQAEVLTPNSGVSAICGEKIKTKDVLVFDLEPYAGNPEAQIEFISRHIAAEDYIFASETAEFIQTKLSHTRYDRDSGIKRATKEAAKRGCDMLFVFWAGTDIAGYTNTGSYNAQANTYGNNTNINSYGHSISVPMKRGGAVVMMGDRVSK